MSVERILKQKVENEGNQVADTVASGLFLNMERLLFKNE